VLAQGMHASGQPVSPGERGLLPLLHLGYQGGLLTLCVASWQFTYEGVTPEDVWDRPELQHPRWIRRPLAAGADGPWL